MAKPKIKSDGRTITVRVPISIRKRGGRKVVLAPDGAPCVTTLFCQRPDDAMVKAIARAFRWREMLEDGTCATIKEIAVAEGINESYVARLLRLALLAPNVVQSILENRLSPKITLATLMHRFPSLWQDQEASLKHHS